MCTFNSKVITGICSALKAIIHEGATMSEVLWAIEWEARHIISTDTESVYIYKNVSIERIKRILVVIKAMTQTHLRTTFPRVQYDWSRATAHKNLKTNRPARKEMPSLYLTHRLLERVARRTLFNPLYISPEASIALSKDAETIVKWLQS